MIYTAFKDNKYTTWYTNIIQSALSNPRSGYTEKHHIIPKSLGGSNDKTNLVRLSAREHYVCHLLLTKMLDGESKTKMVYGVWRMMNQKSKLQHRLYSVSSRLYESVRTKHSQSMSRTAEEKYGKEKANIMKQKQSANHRGYNSEETRRKISNTIIEKKNRWYNDGTESKLFPEEQQPYGWTRGRTPYLKNKWRWYNNGIEAKRMIEGQQPADWVLGKNVL